MRTDASLSETTTLPTGAGTSFTPALDLGHSDLALPPPVECQVEAPAVDGVELPDGETLRYWLEHASQSDFSDAEPLADVLFLQTGAGGLGAAAALHRIGFVSSTRRYVRLAVENSGAGDASAKPAALSLWF